MGQSVLLGTQRPKCMDAGWLSCSGDRVVAGIAPDVIDFQPISRSAILDDIVPQAECLAIATVLGRQGAIVAVSFDLGGVELWCTSPSEGTTIICEYPDVPRAPASCSQTARCLGLDPMGALSWSDYLTVERLKSQSGTADPFVTAGGEDGALMSWGFNHETERVCLYAKHPQAHSPVPAVGGVVRSGVSCVSRSGRCMVSGGSDGGVAFWSDGVSGATRRVAGAHGGAVTAAAASGSGIAATGGEDGVVRFWNAVHAAGDMVLPTGRRCDDKVAADEPITQLALDAHRGRLCAGTEDGLVRIWDLASTRPPRRFAHRARPTTTRAGRARGVQAVAFDLDTEERPMFLASGAADGSWRLWDIRQRERSPVIEQRGAHRRAVVSLAIHGERVLSASADGSAAIWDLRKAPSWIPRTDILTT
mmetsp:Transcript_10517/g.30534  ORF Transcript_10517/g.30534 Transcript_10517/m.30534 type:complete len:420 (-) Transcript_10517:141-1400(-)